MSFVKLSNIGKIYVSEGTVAVGVRGINLDFEKGEFVAVTGESGSGKSTLLNVISGMDTYEEGEMFVEDEPTSYYSQSDWEEFRKKYISFIFQDYNIVGSFTVLENVELALMDYKDPTERRRRALELIERVGLSKFVRKRGSKLSGGQKQRTVIARALAKDSPIILADEPTGNLDSKSGREILQLLKEVSEGKLVIIVTHDFNQVEHLATRHIRIHDGGVEFDVPNSADAIDVSGSTLSKAPAVAENTVWHRLSNSIRLGLTRFKATPILSFFLSFLMIVAALGLFAITSFSASIFQDYSVSEPVFTPVTGRMVVARSDGGLISEEELASLKSKYGAVDVMADDFLLDQRLESTYSGRDFRPTNREKVHVEEGRDPETAFEVSVRLPLSDKAGYRPIALGDYLYLTGDYYSEFPAVRLTVVGIEYVRDNRKPCIANLTDEGFAALNALALLRSRSIYVYLETEDAVYDYSPYITYFTPVIQLTQTDRTTLEMPDRKTLSNAQFYLIPAVQVRNPLTGNVVKPDEFDELGLTYVELTDVVQKPGRNAASPTLQMDPEHIIAAGQVFFDQEYRQASLFFSSDQAARSAASKLRAEGTYTAVAACEKAYQGFNLITGIFSIIGIVFLWFITVGFLVIFISLTTTRAMLSTQGDLAIMRSMGIHVKVIRTSVYFQTLITLIPALIAMAAAAVLVYSFPESNASFTYLPIWAYILIAAVLSLIDVLVAKRYIRKLFGQSVKKTLKGGNAS